MFLRNLFFYKIEPLRYSRLILSQLGIPSFFYRIHSGLHRYLLSSGCVCLKSKYFCIRFVKNSEPTIPIGVGHLTLKIDPAICIKIIFLSGCVVLCRLPGCIIRQRCYFAIFFEKSSRNFLRFRELNSLSIIPSYSQN